MCNILFLVNFIHAGFLVNIIQALHMLFMIVSFNSLCDVCNRFYQLNLNVDVDVNEITRRK